MKANRFDFFQILIRLILLLCSSNFDFPHKFQVVTFNNQYHTPSKADYLLTITYNFCFYQHFPIYMFHQLTKHIQDYILRKILSFFLQIFDNFYSFPTHKVFYLEIKCNISSIFYKLLNFHKFHINQFSQIVRFQYIFQSRNKSVPSTKDMRKVFCLILLYNFK